MVPEKYSGLITCIAAAGIGMFVAMWLLDFSVVRSDWCNGAETKCFREWIGALSGWIAAGGALLTAALTLPHLRQQAAEAKRQSDFALGDSLPTFDVYSEDFVDVYFRVVNWNRRTLLLDEIKYFGVTSVKIISIKRMEDDFSDEIISQTDEDYAPSFIPAIRISGHENKNTLPNSCIIAARVFGGSAGKPTTVTGTFHAIGRLLGEKHGSVSLEATAEIQTFISTGR